MSLPDPVARMDLSEGDRPFARSSEACGDPEIPPFWQLDQPSDATAVIDARSGQAVSYGALRALADGCAQKWKLPRRTLVFVFAQNDLDSLAAYLAGLRAGHPVALLSATAPTDSLLAAYAPERVVGTGPFAGYTAIADRLWRRDEPRETPAPHAGLALLLSTSGSTGSPKMVRLSGVNLQANATAIGSYLGLAATERAPTTLPLSYSFGLSVVNSHLAVGATVVLGEFPVVQQDTWLQLARHGATSFAGVPLLYQIRRRMRYDPRTAPGVRTYTQAGGRLDAETKLWFLDQAEAAGARFFAMYGQTEATARISFVPPAQLRAKSDSIGRPIPGGELSVDPAGGELVFRGPGVMLGYAESPADLSLGDVQRGVLRTGDLGHVDANGFFYVTGRLKRFLKLAGLRVSLDELERRLEIAFACPVACGGQDEALRVQLEAAVPGAQVFALLREKFGIAPSLATVHPNARIARLPTGKIDYAALAHG